MRWRRSLVDLPCHFYRKFPRDNSQSIVDFVSEPRYSPASGVVDFGVFRTVPQTFFTSQPFFSPFLLSFRPF